MRLTTSEIHSIIQIISNYLNFNAELRLFGSRVDDSEKGGDIDLLLIIESSRQKSIVVNHKSEILASLKDEIGDQKIDLLIRSEEELNDDIFVKTIMPTSICLKKWSP